jgi:mevalonate kinase
VYGGAGVVHRHRDLGRRVPIDADLATLGGRLVLIHGSGSRNSGSIIEQVLHERPRSQVLRIIEAMNDVGGLLALSLATGDHDRLADLINESTALLRELHPDIVGDGVAESFRELGALAAKPCGAGGPGAVWACLVDPRSRPAFVASVGDAGWSALRAAPSGVGAVRRPDGVRSARAD